MKRAHTKATNLLMTMVALVAVCGILADFGGRLVHSL